MYTFKSVGFLFILAFGFFTLSFESKASASRCGKSPSAQRGSLATTSCTDKANGTLCGSESFCFDGVCEKKPGRMFCYTEHCMVECNDGYIDRDLCTPCEKQCDTICADHGGCKATCERAEGRVFDKECPVQP